MQLTSTSRLFVTRIRQAIKFIVKIQQKLILIPFGTGHITCIIFLNASIGQSNVILGLQYNIKLLLIDDTRIDKRRLMPLCKQIYFRIYGSTVLYNSLYVFVVLHWRESNVLYLRKKEILYLYQVLSYFFIFFFKLSYKLDSER